MKFDLVDRVLERSEDRIVTLKQVSASEEYLQDHFPTFPVLPGVLMLEAMVQAARELVHERSEERLVLGDVRALKYGAFVKPGFGLRVEVDLVEEDGGEFRFQGCGLLVGGGENGAAERNPATAVSGRFTLRGVRVGGVDELAVGLAAE